MSNYEARLKRIADCVALSEPDRVPIMTPLQGYPIFRAGYSMKDVIYDFDKGADAIIKYVKEYEPDSIHGHPVLHMGQGPILELLSPKTCTWAGAPGTKIKDNSIHQYLEFPVLVEEEMDFFSRDYSGWLLEKALPKISGLLEPFAGLGISRMSTMYLDLFGFAARMNAPDVRKAIETLWKVGDMVAEVGEKYHGLDEKLEEVGFPILSKGVALVPFDNYSDAFRGTLDSMTDLYDNEELIVAFCKTQLEYTLESIRAQKAFVGDKWVFMPLHKGMDKFLSDEQYKKYYWNDLQIIIEEIVKNGMNAYIYTEGPYNTRLEFLKEVPKGKVIYHFEQCDMPKAKKVLGDTACISGGFPIYLLEHGTKQEVIDECKRLIDGCAHGGGYIFETGSGFDESKPENVEAMFETVKTYGSK